MYELKDVLGKGKGLVATKNVPQGTRILCEEAVIRIPHNLDQPGSEKLQKYIRQQVNALTEQQRLAFLSLHNIYPYKNPAEQYIGIIRTNAFSIEDDVAGGGVFLEASRINHACDNNSHKSWNENIKRHTVHALRDINKGEEFTIYYLAVHSSWQARRRRYEQNSSFHAPVVFARCHPNKYKKMMRYWKRLIIWIVSLVSVIFRGYYHPLSEPCATLIERFSYIT